ncbi:MAG: fumarylacetoacetate hydrolase family protein [Rhizobiales bacterium]|nr:fumarylacetoacetate hydrolase family protein [Hyphomicrobiales bacterium]
MKLGSFRSGSGAPWLGVLDGEGRHAFDIRAAVKVAGRDPSYYSSMQSLIDAGDRGLDELRNEFEKLASCLEFARPLEHLVFLPPLPEPRQLRDVSLYAEHIRHATPGMQRVGVQVADPAAVAVGEVAADIPPIFRERVVFYFQNRLNLVGHRAEITWPADSEVIDFELELGIVLGKTAADIPKADARSIIFGYTIYNDFSARDTQYWESKAGFGPAKAKSFDGANACGPWIVTADEIADPMSLRMGVRVNGELWAETSSAAPLHDIDDVLAYLSRSETLHAGEFIGLGTVGRGCGLELGRFLKRGDSIELWVENIGSLVNSIK